MFVFGPLQERDTINSETVERPMFALVKSWIEMQSLLLAVAQYMLSIAQQNLFLHAVDSIVAGSKFPWRIKKPGDTGRF